MAGPIDFETPLKALVVGVFTAGVITAVAVVSIATKFYSGTN